VENAMCRVQENCICIKGFNKLKVFKHLKKKEKNGALDDPGNFFPAA
jgi:hypothetical protein